MIKKNPLWFMEAKSSNSAQISSGAYNFPQVVAADHHILPTLYEVVHFTDNFWPFFILLAIVVSLQFRRDPNPVGLPIALGSLGAPLFQAVLLYKHSSADWDRFFIYYIPFGFLLGAFLVSRVAKPKLRNVLAVLSCLVLISADYGAWQGLHSSVWGNGSTGYISAIGQKINEFAHLDGRRVRYRGEFINVYQQLTPMQGIADYVNKHPALRVLVVADIMPWIERPNQVIFGNEADFQAVLLNPRGRVNSIIVAPSATLSQDVDAIDRQYPTMWGGGVPWTRLVKQLPAGYRLYEVLDNAP
jgi:hypothetical protein